MANKVRNSGIDQVIKLQKPFLWVVCQQYLALNELKRSLSMDVAYLSL